jgi:hypothetical protein
LCLYGYVVSIGSRQHGVEQMTKKVKKAEKTNLPTFGWLDAYKAKKIERDPARKEREMQGREALLEDK